MTPQHQQSAQPDLYRDTWVRYLGVPAGAPSRDTDRFYRLRNFLDQPGRFFKKRLALGYANEVGESFRALVPKALVWVTYGISTAYVTADAADKGKKAAQLNKDSPRKTKEVTVAVIDTFVWQALASVAIPGFTINRICAASLYIMGRVTRWPLPARKWATTAIGLSAIPVIITPIDRSVDFLLDSSLRKLYHSPSEKTDDSRTT